MAELKVKPISGDCANPRLSVIFVHGLGGDAVGTWCYEGGEDGGYFWPRGLAEDMSGLAVYSLGYPADKASWGSGWPIAEAAVAVLERLMSNRALRASGDTPIVFVCHSLGGLIIKKLVLIADRDRGQDAQKGKFLDRIRGVVFLATPHGGSIMATIPSQLQWFVSDAMRDLKANDAALLDLSNSYRNCIADNRGRIRHCVFYEKRPMFGVAKAVVPMSADPGIAGVRPVPIDRDHGAICKPLDRDDPVYEGTLRFLEDALAPVPLTLDEKLDVVLQKVSQKESVPLETLRAILAEMGEAAESSNAVEIEKKLTAKASEFVSLNDRLNRLSNADPKVSRLRHAAATALRKGRFAEADACLAAAEARDLSGVEEIEALAKEKHISAAEQSGRLRRGCHALCGGCSHCGESRWKCRA
jgi:pimeloyl-ACP methyl ester carboxylesterase